jgi:hypothetical protein
MRLTIGSLLLAAVFSILGLAASCGSTIQPGDSTGASQPGGNILPPGSPLPQLSDEAGDGGGLRSASVLTGFKGKDFFSASGATVVGDSLLLESEDNGLAWALYKVTGLSGMTVETFSIEALPGVVNETYSVGISNFTDDRWEFFVTTSLPEVDHDFSDYGKRLVSNAGNLYYVVVVADGASVRIDQATLDIVEGGPDGLAAPTKLTATADQNGGIYLYWTGSEGAEGYEIWRRDGGDSNGGPDGNPGGDPGQSEWLLIATSSWESFEDYNLPAQQLFEYRVRAFAGDELSDFSETVSVWSGDGGGQEQYAYGAIESIDALSLTVGGVSFGHDDATIWMEMTGEIVTWEAFAAGDIVSVSGVINADGSVHADNVYRGNEFEDDYFTFTGTITFIGDGRIELDQNMAALYDDSTVWYTANGEQVGPDHFAAGDMVLIEGKGDPSGGIHATTVMELGNQP